VLRVAGEALAQFGSCVATPTGQVFRWHTRIMMQPMRHQRRGGETEFLRAEQRGDRHVAAGLQLTVRLDVNAAAQVVQHQRLVRFRQAEFPRSARVFDATTAAMRRCRRRGRRSGRHPRAPWRRPRRSCRRRLRATSFTLMRACAVGVLQVVDQLRQIFDGVDVMVRRRRNQTDARLSCRESWRCHG
jgi:hypothetical protein